MKLVHYEIEVRVSLNYLTTVLLRW